jgi:hypothetical protein
MDETYITILQIKTCGLWHVNSFFKHEARVAENEDPLVSPLWNFSFWPRFNRLRHVNYLLHLPFLRLL